MLITYNKMVIYIKNSALYGQQNSFYDSGIGGGKDNRKDIHGLYKIKVNFVFTHSVEV